MFSHLLYIFLHQVAIVQLACVVPFSRVRPSLGTRRPHMAQGARVIAPILISCLPRQGSRAPEPPISAKSAKRAVSGLKGKWRAVAAAAAAAAVAKTPTAPKKHAPAPRAASATSATSTGSQSDSAQAAATAPGDVASGPKAQKKAN